MEVVCCQPLIFTDANLNCFGKALCKAAFARFLLGSRCGGEGSNLIPASKASASMNIPEVLRLKNERSLPIFGLWYEQPQESDIPIVEAGCAEKYKKTREILRLELSCC